MNRFYWSYGPMGLKVIRVDCPVYLGKAMWGIRWGRLGINGRIVVLQLI